MTTSEIATVLAWHDALMAKDMNTLVDLSSDDIEIGDANGAAQGLEALPYYFDMHPEMVVMARRVIQATLKAQEVRPA